MIVQRYFEELDVPQHDPFIRYSLTTYRKIYESRQRDFPPAILSSNDLVANPYDRPCQQPGCLISGTIKGELANMPGQPRPRPLSNACRPEPLIDEGSAGIVPVRMCPS